MSDKHIELTRLQGGIAIASFCIGAVISIGCLFFIKPLGEITSSAIITVGTSWYYPAEYLESRQVQT